MSVSCGMVQDKSNSGPGLKMHTLNKKIKTITQIPMIQSMHSHTKKGKGLENGKTKAKAQRSSSN